MVAPSLVMVTSPTSSTSICACAWKVGTGQQGEKQSPSSTPAAVEDYGTRTGCHTLSARQRRLSSKKRIRFSENPIFQETSLVCLRRGQRHEQPQ